MQQIQDTLKEEEPLAIPMSRVDDKQYKHIMDIIIASPLIPEKDYKEMNYCQMYLQVTTLGNNLEPICKMPGTETLQSETKQSTGHTNRETRESYIMD